MTISVMLTGLQKSLFVLLRSQQDKRKEQQLLKEIQQELQETEKKYQGKLSEQGELIRSLKGRLVELLR